MGRIAAFIEWHLFSPTLHKCSEQNRQGSSWGRHFPRLHRQWQTCGNYLKSKQTPGELPFLLSFVTSILQAAYVYCGCVFLYIHVYAQYEPHRFCLYLCPGLISAWCLATRTSSSLFPCTCTNKSIIDNQAKATLHLLQPLGPVRVLQETQINRQRFSSILLHSFYFILHDFIY